MKIWGFFKKKDKEKAAEHVPEAAADAASGARLIAAPFIANAPQGARVAGRPTPHAQPPAPEAEPDTAPEPAVEARAPEPEPTLKPTPEPAPSAPATPEFSEPEPAKAERSPEVDAAPPLDSVSSAPVAQRDPDEDNLFGRLWKGLSKSSAKLSENVTSAFVGKPLDQATLDELEEILIRSDMGAPAAAKIVAAIGESRFNRTVTDTEIKSALAAEIAKILKKREIHLDLTQGPRPHVVLVVGVNGSGKTTTIGKLCYLLSRHGAKVVVGAADTFRAAAIEQLRVWAERSGAGIVARGQGADAAGVAFDAVAMGREQGADVVLIDTAGRLQNKTELMAELDKIIRAIRKVDDDAPHQTLLVLDATVGQNALHQMEAFRTTADISGIVMTKLDGTAKGGVLVALAERHAVPIHFVGVGESAEDLQPFDAEAFARALAG